MSTIYVSQALIIPEDEVYLAQQVEPPKARIIRQWLFTVNVAPLMLAELTNAAEEHLTLCVRSYRKTYRHPIRMT